MKHGLLYPTLHRQGNQRYTHCGWLLPQLAGLRSLTEVSFAHLRTPLYTRRPHEKCLWPGNMNNKTNQLTAFHLIKWARARCGNMSEVEGNGNLQRSVNRSRAGVKAQHRPKLKRIYYVPSVSISCSSLALICTRSRMRRSTSAKPRWRVKAIT